MPEPIDIKATMTRYQTRSRKLGPLNTRSKHDVIIRNPLVNMNCIYVTLFARTARHGYNDASLIETLPKKDNRNVTGIAHLDNG